jgi:arginyl-tRNA synthetase
MIKQEIEKLIQQALSKLQDDGKLEKTLTNVQIENTKDKQHGDFACNIALVLAKSAQKKPRELAEWIVQALPSSSKIAKVEISGPGFINFLLADNALHNVIAEILKRGSDYGKSTLGQHKKINIEFVSSNPTGPLHVGHGRHGAYGAVVGNLLAHIGYQVHREYYVNDAGRQMDILAVSVWLRYLALLGEKFVLPINVYKGDYVIDIAKLLMEKYGKQFHFPTEKIFSGLPLDEPMGGDKEIYIDAVIAKAKELCGDAQFELMIHFSLANILSDIRKDLEEFGVKFDEWFSERAFVKTGAVDRAIKKLQQAGFVYEREGALWFRSTDFNDEKDRVLQRANGIRTYFANDLAYHINKFERGFDYAIDVFGSDHHGYVPRMKAGLQAAGISPDKLTYLLVQFVTLYRGGKQAQMSTRSGSFVTLRELREEVGNDAARFFYVMRKYEQHMDFDLDLAKAQSNENPVYYIQYAHARICSVFRQLKEKGLNYDEQQGLQQLELLKEPNEFQLIGTLSRYNETIKVAAEQYEPYLLTHYLRELANHFHVYYNSYQFIVEDTMLRNARLTLIAATRQILKNGLNLLNVSAPDTM